MSENTFFCSARGCDTKVPRCRLMCKRHWFLVPADIRALVFNTQEQWKKTRHHDDLQRYREATGKAVASLVVTE